MRSSSSLEKEDDSNINSSPKQGSEIVDDDLLSLVKEMSPNVKEVVYGRYKKLCQVNLDERLLKFYEGDSWFDNAEQYSGPIIDDIFAATEFVGPLLLGHGDIQKYKIVIDDFDDLEVVVMRYSGDGSNINAFFDAKTSRPLLFDFDGNKIQPFALTS